jgi:nucleoside-diphosphate-sugar epimerase
VDLMKREDVFRLMLEVRPAHLLHFAWYTEPGKYWTSLENFRWIKASLDLLEAFAANGGERLVAAGSCAEYEWQDETRCSEASTPLKPATLYGTSKHSLRLMLEAFARQAGLSVAWGRIFFLYGPHEHESRLISSVINSLLRGEPARCSHGNQRRDFLYVEDVAEAFVELLSSDVRGAVNIGSGQAVALKEVVFKIGRQLEHEDLIRLNTVPAPLGEPALLIADAGRLSLEVGWKPRYDLDSGLGKTINWWKAHRHSSRLN